MLKRSEYQILVRKFAKEAANETRSKATRALAEKYMGYAAIASDMARTDEQRAFNYYMLAN